MLREAMQSAVQDIASVAVAASTVQLVDEMLATEAELVLIDAAAAPSKLDEFLRQVHSQFPAAQVLLAGTGSVQSRMAALIGDGTVFRFIHKPVSAQRLKLFVDSALRERQVRQEAIAPVPVSRDEPMRTSVVSGLARRGWQIPASIGAGVLVCAACIAVWYAHSSTMSAQALKAARPMASATPKPVVGLSAAEQEAIDRLVAERFERLQQSGVTQASGEKSVPLTATQKREGSASKVVEIREVLAMAKDRIASGALVEPAEDNARSYVSVASRLAPEDPEVRAVRVALGEALVAAFRSALSAGDTAAAAQWLQACRTHPVRSATLEQLTADLQAQSIHDAASSSPVQALTPAAASIAPRVADAATGSDSNGGIVPENTLRRVQFEAPTYPPAALQRHETGTVDMEFTVTPEGGVTGIKVIRASSGMFETASVFALSHCRYEPVQRDGVPVRQRARIRMRFVL